VNSDKQGANEIAIMLEISRKNSLTIRYILAVIVLLSISVLYIFWSHKNDLSGYMDKMTKDISVMSNATVKMQINMSKLEIGINEVVTNTQSISSSITHEEIPVETLLLIADTVKLMQTDAHGLGKSIENVNYNLSTINKQMKRLNKKLGYIVQDTNRMPLPTNMFPF